MLGSSTARLATMERRQAVRERHLTSRIPMLDSNSDTQLIVYHIYAVAWRVWVGPLREVKSAQSPFSNSASHSSAVPLSTNIQISSCSLSIFLVFTQCSAVS